MRKFAEPQNMNKNPSYHEAKGKNLNIHRRPLSLHSHRRTDEPFCFFSSFFFLSAARSHNTRMKKTTLLQQRRAAKTLPLTVLMNRDKWMLNICWRLKPRPAVEIVVLMITLHLYLFPAFKLAVLLMLVILCVLETQIFNVYSQRTLQSTLNNPCMQPHAGVEQTALEWTNRGVLDSHKNCSFSSYFESEPRFFFNTFVQHM